MEKYRLLKNEATADIAFKAYGRDLSELFENVAVAISNIMVFKIKKEGDVKINFRLHGKNVDYLLIDFINKILLYKDYKGVIVTNVKVKIDKNLNLYCSANAEKLEKLKSRFLVDVKAATLHDFGIKKEKELIICKIVLDV